MNHGDVFADLLGAAVVAAARPLRKAECRVGMPVVHAKLGPGEITDTREDLKFIDYVMVQFGDGGTPQKMWTGDLTKAPKAAPAPKLPPVIAPSTVASLQAFIAYCQQNSYRLFVLLRQLDERQHVADEYKEWTGGETLPDNAIKDYSGTPGTFYREWVLSTRYSEDIPCHIPIEEVGTGRGRGHLMEPHGVRNGSRVNFSSPETIAEVLQAGLRAQA
jgi:hypothetical protein